MMSGNGSHADVEVPLQRNIIKNTLLVGNWNLQGLNAPGKIDLLIGECERYKLDVLATTELHWLGKDKIKHGMWDIIYSGCDGPRREHSVGLFMSPQFAKSLLSYDFISDRLLLARFKCHPVNVSVIVCYAPTNREDRPGDIESKDAFYEDLYLVTSTLPKHDVHLVIGDFNAQLGNDTAAWKPALGKHAVGELNENGSRLLTFCNENDLVVGSSMFDHKNIHKLTWRSPDGKTRTQIDHTMINRRWRRSLEDVRVYRGATVGGDHDLAISKVKLSLAACRRKPSQPRYDTERLLQGDVQTKFDVGIAERMAESRGTGDIDHQWQEFVDAVNEVAKREIGVRRGKRRKVWISPASISLVEKRKEAKARDDNQRISVLNKEVKSSLRSDQKQYYSGIADDLERAANRGDIRSVYKLRKELAGEMKKKATLIRDKSGKIIKDENARRKRWAEYFTELLNTADPTTEFDFEGVTFLDVIDIGEDPPSMKEIKEAVSLLKRRKAAGIDNITGELFKDGGDTILIWLEKICRVIWSDEVTPRDWSKGVIIPLPKKGDLSHCSNNRGITLLSVAGKIFFAVMMLRIRDTLDTRLRENQAGFRRGRS